MITARTLRILLLPVALLPIAAMLLLLFARLFALLEIPNAPLSLDIAAIVVAVFWLLDLVALLIAVVLKILQEETSE